MEITKPPVIDAPELDIDKVLFKDEPMPFRCRIERRVIANLLAYLAANGFTVRSVHDGEDTVETADAKAVLELVFNLDESWLHVYKPGNKGSHTVYIILGNGLDCIADYGYYMDDRDNFNSVMQAFDENTCV